MLAALVSMGALAGCSSSSPPAGHSDDRPTIAIAILAPANVFDANIEAMKKAVAAGGVMNAKYELLDAQGDVSNIGLIVKRIEDMHPSLVYEIGTPLIQATAHATSSIPIFFGLMLDPVGAGVVKDLAHPGGNVTGVVLTVPAAFAFDVITATLPRLSRIGIVGDTAQQNTNRQIGQLKAEASRRSISVRVAPVASTNDVQLAVRSLAGKVDALLVPADNTVVGAIDVVVKAATDAGLPTFSTFNPAGASLVSMGQSYAKLGATAGQRIVQILRGASPGTLPVIVPGRRGVEVTVDHQTERELGITVPGDIAGP